MLLDIINKKAEQFKTQQELSMSYTSESNDKTIPDNCNSVVTYDFTALIRQENAPSVNTPVTLISILENNLSCIREDFSVAVDVPNPCGTGTIHCPVSLNKFRYVGSLKIALNIPLTGTNLNCYQYFSDYLFINSIRCYTSANDYRKCPATLQDFLGDGGISALVLAVGDMQTLGYVPVTIRVSISLTSPCSSSDGSVTESSNSNKISEIPFPIANENKKIKDVKSNKINEAPKTNKTSKNKE